MSQSYSGFQFQKSGLNTALGPSSKVPSIIANAVHDPQPLDELAANTTVIVNCTRTPFIDKALAVAEARAKHGTCYADTSGEVPL
jgi:short subunit dehydrogenase-like uncharacterized protein